MECNGKNCPMQRGFDTERCERGIKCPYFTPKIEQKSAEYYEGFYDAAQLIMAALKARERG